MLINGVEYILNPDKEARKVVVEAIKANDGYCPCVIEKNEDTKCNCKKFREEGDCHCGLWIRK